MQDIVKHLSQGGPFEILQETDEKGAKQEQEYAVNYFLNVHAYPLPLYLGISLQ